MSTMGGTFYETKRARQRRLTPRKSAPRLTVVNGDVDTARNVLTFVFTSGSITCCRFSVEMWTDEQWKQLHPSQRYPDADYLPGFGWMRPLRFMEGGPQWEAEEEAATECQARYKMPLGLDD